MVFVEMCDAMVGALWTEIPTEGERERGASMRASSCCTRQERRLFIYSSLFIPFYGLTVHS